MRLSETLMIVLRRWWLVALLGLIAAGSTYVLTSRQQPVYRSTQLVLIQPSRSDFGLTEASRLLLNPMVVYLRSSQIAASIIDELQLPYTPLQLLDNTTIAPDTLRMVIQVDVDSTDPEIGQSVARAWGQTLIDYRAQQNQIAAREDRVLAILPDVPSSSQIAPQPLFNAVAAALLGVLIGVALCFLLEFIESAVIRRRQDLERANLAVLASVPDRA
jgi:capsular polysaccharide biosynthesis protein